MGKIRQVNRVKLFAGMFSADPEYFHRAEVVMAGLFGPVDFRTDILTFGPTDYYQEEMGQGLKRKFISFGNLIVPDELPAVKITTNKLEKEFADAKGRRRINIDPGYVSAAKTVLATTKDYSHRLYLGQGIYGEVTLQFHSKTFQPLEWTYPDYRSTEYIAFFNSIREIYLRGHNT